MTQSAAVMISLDFDNAQFDNEASSLQFGAA
jgi:hypothetical protein